MIADLEEKLLAAVVGPVHEVNVDEAHLTGISFVRRPVSNTQHPSVHSWLTQDALHEVMASDILLELRNLETVRRAPYDKLKRRLRHVRLIRTKRGDLSNEQVQSLVNLINLDWGFEGKVRDLVDGNAGGSIVGAVVGAVIATLSSKDESKQRVTPLAKLVEKPDVVFASELEALLTTSPEYGEVINQIKEEMISILRSKIKKLLESAPNVARLMREKLYSNVDQQFSERINTHEENSWQELKRMAQTDLLADVNRKG